MPTVSLENNVAYPGRGSQSPRVYNLLGKRQKKETILGQHWFIENNSVKETMKIELKLKPRTCDIKYQCNHFEADNMHGN